MTKNFLSHRPNSEFPYRIEKVAGEGAMGVVYRATDETLNRPVAIKVLRDDGSQTHLDKEQRQRFRQEARAAAALAHPGVTTVHQIGKVEGAPYIVMEWLEGLTVEDLIHRNGAVPAGRANRYMQELLEVLGFAHRSGVIHRDIKPSNLVVLEDDRLKVTDFGIAFLQDQALVKTMAGSVLATPRYASPEQLQGQKVDGRSDLFSAALVFYQLLTADLPWKGQSFAGLLRALLEEAPIPVRDSQPHLPATIDGWFERALAIDRDFRFKDAATMATALRQVFDTPSSLHRTEPLRATASFPAPIRFFHASRAQNLCQVTLQMIATWPSKKLGSMDLEGLLAKLLDQPIHAEAFAGAATIGNHLLLVEKGMVLAALDLERDLLDSETVLPNRAEVSLHSLPSDHAPGTIALLASAFGPVPPRHAGLDTTTIHLSAFAGKLLAEGFRGTLRLDSRDGIAWLLLDERRTTLALLAGEWLSKPQEQAWDVWLESTPMSASFFDASLAPPNLWFQHAFRNLELQVVPATLNIPLDGSSKTLTETMRPDIRLFKPLADGSDSDQAISVGAAPIAKFLNFFLEKLPVLLLERNKAAGWKYLGDWVLQIRQAELYTHLSRSKEDILDAFDLVTRDKEGKILHLACRAPEATPQVLEAFVQKVIAAKETRKERGDVGGAILIAPSFSEAVLDSYRSLLHKGFGNRLLGLDKSMGYEGFIRLTSRRGFHLLLVEEENGRFKPHFVT